MKVESLPGIEDTEVEEEKGSGRTYVITQIDKLLRYGEKNPGISVI